MGSHESIKNDNIMYCGDNYQYQMQQDVQNRQNDQNDRNNTTTCIS
jgi:hypothetical protein